MTAMDNHPHLHVAWWKAAADLTSVQGRCGCWPDDGCETCQPQRDVLADAEKALREVGEW